MNLFRNHRIAAVAFAVMLMVVGCGDALVENTSPLTETADLAPNKTGTPSWLVLMQPGVAPGPVASRNQLTVSGYYAAGDLALLEGNVNPVDLENDPDVFLAQQNLAISLGPIDLIMGFYEGELTMTNVRTQPSLAPMLLDQVHAAAAGGLVRAAVLDTGIDPNHSHLANRWILDPVAELGDPFEAKNNRDDDFDGLTDEGYGHGTHVAGTILTVAPGAKVVPYKVLGEDGNGSDYTLAVGLMAAKNAAVDVINISLSLNDNSPVIEAILDRAKALGIEIFAAAGNTGADPVFPATHSSVWSVASTDASDALSAFSARGAVEFAAPGEGIVSSFPNQRMAVGDGTSMACAVASGAACLMLGPGPYLANDPLAELRVHTAPITPATAVHSGRVDPFEAYEMGP